MEITSGDVVRALLRAGNPSQVVQDASNPGWVYLRLIDGFDAYSAGTGGSTISGVTTPDPHTITIREVRPDRTLADIFAMPFTAPIPPSPTDPSAPLGAATGHPWIDGTGYGPFQAATGPYMFEGAGDLDPSAPAAEQRPPSGMALRQDPKDNDFYSIPGTITLVRNPSWSAASDPVHLAYPDRIEIRMMPATDAYAAVAAGTTDTVMGEDPPPGVIRRYTSEPALQDRIVSQPRAATFFGTVNVAQPPFDDVHVRRALVALLDPRALARLFRLTGSPGTATSHLVPDPLDASHLASWYPADAVTPAAALATAHAEMRRSRFGSAGRCTGPSCTVTVEIPPARSGRRTGRRGRDVLPHGARRARDHPEVHPDAELPEARSVLRAERHIAVCALGGWAADYPDAGNMFVAFLSPDVGASRSLLGATPEQLRSWQYEVHDVPAIDDDYARCAASASSQASLCWARLDQLVTTGLAAAFPAYTPNAIRVHSARVTAFSLDQAFSEPSLDRIALAG